MSIGKAGDYRNPLTFGGRSCCSVLVVVVLLETVHEREVLVLLFQLRNALLRLLQREEYGNGIVGIKSVRACP